jgi:hypothetical protein
LNKVKAITTKQTSAIFLLVVLVTGTFALSLSSPSSFSIGEAKAQTEYRYGYDDNNSYNSKYQSEYEPKKYKDNYYQQKDPPADITVPTPNFPTIQKAINTAQEGDVIKVLPGTTLNNSQLVKV